MVRWTWGRVINGRERSRLAAGTLVSVMALTFGWPLGGVGLVICLVGIAIGIAVVAPVWVVEGEFRFPRVDALTASGMWAGVTIAVFVFAFGGQLIFLMFMGWFCATALLALMILWALFTKWRIAVGASVVVAVATGLAFLLVPLRLAFWTAQVRVAESSLRSDMLSDDSYQQFDGIHGWIWIGGVPDGGSGVAFDPTDRLVDDSFAREAWASITGDTATCQLMYDHWYWCGVS